MKRLVVLFAAWQLAACVTVADAGSLVDVNVIDRSNGQRLPVYRHGGRAYVAGAPGNRYAVELYNKSSGRLLTVLSVDGVNAVSGQTAATSQSGYVLGPGQLAEIGGWRKSLDDVAAFYFTSVADSYAGRTDRPQNVGVIGVAVYREATPAPAVAAPPVAAAPLERGRLGAAANEAPAAEAKEATRDQATMRKSESRLGTGHGERISSPTQSTEFRRAGESPAEFVTIYYDSRANLIAQGIIPRSRPTSPALPNPFPGSFVPDPRN